MYTNFSRNGFVCNIEWSAKNRFTYRPLSCAFFNRIDLSPPLSFILFPFFFILYAVHSQTHNRKKIDTFENHYILNDVKHLSHHLSHYFFQITHLHLNQVLLLILQVWVFSNIDDIFWSFQMAENLSKLWLHKTLNSMTLKIHYINSKFQRSTKYKSRS